jgi:hypothetical protein
LAHLLSEKAGQKYKISPEEQKLLHEYITAGKEFIFWLLLLILSH